MKHPHTSIILSRLSIPLVLKCAAKTLKIGLQKKNLMSKNAFEQGFCIGNGDNPKTFNFRFWHICQLYANVWTPGKLFLQFGVGSMKFNKILELLFFPVNL